MKLQELPDESAAAALSRLPGISLMNGDQVVIRGIQAKQNLILVNGIQLPSTDVNTRATNLGFISSNMLDGIEVVNFPFNDKFPKGMLVVQDGYNFSGDTLKNQNFKYISWEKIESLLNNQ